MPEIDPARFRELVKRRDYTRARLWEANDALRAANEARDSADKHRLEAEVNLENYVRECSGDPKRAPFEKDLGAVRKETL